MTNDRNARRGRERCRYYPHARGPSEQISRTMSHVLSKSALLSSARATPARNYRLLFIQTRIVTAIIAGKEERMRADNISVDDNHDSAVAERFKASSGAEIARRFDELHVAIIAPRITRAITIE